MKRSMQKLVLRSETLRTLSNMDLARVAGGAQSGDKQCTYIYDSGDKACEAPVLVMATANCH
jgi:hypothetical protein